MTTTPGRTGPLPRGWHRVTWTSGGKPKYVVTDCISSATDVQTELTLASRELSWLTNVQIEHWQPS